jgi:hypothetical protein
MSSSSKAPARPEQAGHGPRPLAWVARVALFERETHLRLTATALEVLLEAAERVAEGRVASAIGGGVRFYGTALFTLNLERSGDLFRDPVDEATAASVASQLAQDPRARTRLLELARITVRARLGHILGEALGAELRVRSEATRVFVDLDLEADLAA